MTTNERPRRVPDRGARTSTFLTHAQIRALTVMADCSEWVDTSTRTSEPSEGHRVNGAVAQRLEKMGLAKSRQQTWWGEVVTGADLVHRLGDWHTVYTITREGMRAIGWIGEVLS